MRIYGRDSIRCEEHRAPFVQLVILVIPDKLWYLRAGQAKVMDVCFGCFPPGVCYNQFACCEAAQKRHLTSKHVHQWFSGLEEILEALADTDCAYP